MTEDELILTHILQCPRIDLYLHPPKLTSEQEVHLKDIRKRRADGEPLQYILGECEFMGISLKVDHRVLIPRPETELLVEAALKEMKNFPAQDDVLHALDIGTGSGNISIALLKGNAKWRMVSVDVSKEALELARENAAEQGALAGIKFIEADVLNWLNTANPYQKYFSLVISNPPYVTAEGLKNISVDVQKEPRLALDGGASGLKFYEYIIANVEHVLKPGGWLLFEIGDDQGKSLENLLTQQGSFVNMMISQDHNQRDRIVKAQLKF